MSHAMTARLALAKHEFQYTHSLGQNFLLDDGLISRIADAAGVGDGDCVFEIGAGAGVLTAEMSSRGAKVLALELDRGLEPILTEVLADYPNAKVEYADAMKADTVRLAAEAFGEGATLKVVANLPYYITTDVIIRLLTAALPIESITVLVQQEAAERIMSKPNTKTWCSLAATVQYYGVPSVAFQVPPEAFTPRPHVMSCLLRIELYGENKPFAAQDDAALLRLITAAFAMRRKTLANNLTAAYKMPRERAIELLNAQGLDEKVRGESLSIEQLVKLANALCDAKTPSS